MQSIRRLASEAKDRATVWIGRRASGVASRAMRREYIPLDYPTSARNEPRWVPHGELARQIGERDAAYAAVLAEIGDYRAQFRRIPLHAQGSYDPSWINDWQPGLDSVALYAFLRSRSPAVYLEVGSGASTRFARRAIDDGSLSTSIVSVDPHPRLEVEAICDRVVRAPLEAADLAMFDELASGDVLFFDGSHRVFMNSDATVFFLEALPRLPSGVLVGIHDIYLPWDYPSEIANRYYSEQYLLAAYLLARTRRFQTVLPSWYVSKSEEHRSALDSIWDDPALREVSRHGTAYWVESL
jgi:hypothetical protein